MFYVLTAAPPPSPPECAAQRVIGLGPIRLPEYLDRAQLVTRTAANQLRITEFERWAEPLADAFASTLRQDLAATLPSDTVVVYPYDATIHPDVEIAIDVLRFERTSDHSVELAARWTMRDGTGQVRLVKEARVRKDTVGGDAQSAVAALSEALSTLGREMAAAVCGGR